MIQDKNKLQDADRSGVIGDEGERWKEEQEVQVKGEEDGR